MLRELHSTAASSLTSCGLLPVFSSCRMTPVTMSSLMPWVSNRTSTDGPVGEGGGVSSKARLAFFSVLTTLGEGGDDVCDRLIFFDGGTSVELAVPEPAEGGERFAGSARELGGRWMPNEGNDRDLRRVLYGIVGGEAAGDESDGEQQTSDGTVAVQQDWRRRADDGDVGAAAG